MKVLKNKKGFTLMEMLIVVAIMVILMAVSVPMFTSQLNKAKVTTDQANVKAGKSAVLALYMAGGTVKKSATETQEINASQAGTYYYNTETGELSTSAYKPSVKSGQSGTSDSQANPAAVPKDKVLKFSITAEGVVTYTWE